MRKIFQKIIRNHRIQLGIALCLASLFSLMTVQRVFTQAEQEEDWTQPVNLSHSGSASNPLVLVDSNDIVHALWQDAFEGYLHVQVGEDGVWTAPQEIDVPFEDVQPTVVLGPNDFFYVFWLVEGDLKYSRVRTTNVGLTIGWEPALILANNTRNFDVVVDDDGTIHLAYLIRSDTDIEPGIYYRQKLTGRVWTTQQVVFTSQYFRTMRSSQAHVSIAVGDVRRSSGEESGLVQERKVFVTWDEPFQSRSMVSSSHSGSKIWTEPVVAYSNTGVAGSAMTYKPDVAVWDGQALMVWQEQISDSVCEIYYRVLEEDQHWGLIGESFTSTNGCPDQSGFLLQNDDYLLWHGIFESQIIMTAWDGHQWSQPRAEQRLVGFRDSLSGQTMTLVNHNLFYHNGSDRLFVVGCDQDENQDTWFMQKDLSDLSTWFLPYSSWQSVQAVVENSLGIDNINILADTQGNFHALWLQVPEDSTNINSEQTIHYARWVEDSWSDSSVIGTDDIGLVQQMASAIGGAGNIMLTWRGDAGCRINFTSAPSNHAYSSGEWMEPITLPTPSGICGSPALVFDNNNAVYVAYAVVANEGRGIYLNSSMDGGRTWEDPVQVFDGQAASWELVDDPVLTFSNDRLHILWQERSVLDPIHGKSFGSSFSDDGGLTWSVPDVMDAEKLGWAGLTITTNGLIMRVWQQDGSDQPLISTQISLDSGQTWLPATTIAAFGEVLGTPALITDPHGGIHLLQIVCDYLGRLTLQHWVWYSDNWIAQESFSLGYSSNADEVNLTGVISQQDFMMVLYTNGYSENGTQPLYALVSQAGSSLELQNSPDIQLPIQRTVAPTEFISEDVPDIATKTPTVIPVFTTNPDTRPNSTNSWLAPIIGAVFAFGLIGGVVLLRVLKQRK